MIPQMAVLPNFKNHRLYRIWSRVPINYYQKGVKKNIFQRIWHNHKINIAGKLLKNINFANCLDLGCASGNMISVIAKVFPGRKYFGVDVYDKAIEFARKNYPQITFKVASANDLPFKDNFFDLILCYETIEHLEKPLESLLEVKRVLKNGGILLLATDSQSRLFRIVWKIWENTYGKVWKGAHLHPFNHKELESLILSSGFKIQKKLFSHLGMEVIFVLSKTS